MAILNKVIAYVDTYTEDRDANMSHLVSLALKSLGATVLKRLSPRVNVVVWHNGLHKTLRAVQKMERAVLVSPSWVYSCKEKQKYLDPNAFALNVSTLVGEIQSSKKRRSFEVTPENLPDPMDSRFSSSQQDETIKATHKKRKMSTRDKLSSKKNEKNTEQARSSIETRTGMLSNERQLPLKQVCSKDSDINYQLCIALSSADDFLRDVAVSCIKKLNLVYACQTKTELINAQMVDSEELGCATHLIVGQERRTIKTLFAAARGLWILTPSFLLESMEKDHWVSEIPHVVEWLPAAKISIDNHFRMACPSNVWLPTNPVPPRVLDGMNVSVGSHDFPSKIVLESLSKLAGANITKESDSNKNLSGKERGHFETSIVRVLKKLPRHTKKNEICVKTDWLLDSIAQGKVLSFNSYLWPCSEGSSLLERFDVQSKSQKREREHKNTTKKRAEKKLPLGCEFEEKLVNGEVQECRNLRKDCESENLDEIKPESNPDNQSIRKRKRSKQEISQPKQVNRKRDLVMAVNNVGEHKRNQDVVAKEKVDEIDQKLGSLQSGLENFGSSDQNHAGSKGKKSQTKRSKPKKTTILNSSKGRSGKINRDVSTEPIESMKKTEETKLTTKSESKENDELLRTTKINNQSCSDKSSETSPHLNQSPKFQWKSRQSPTSKVAEKSNLSPLASLQSKSTVQNDKTSDFISSNSSVQPARVDENEEFSSIPWHSRSPIRGTPKRRYKSMRSRFFVSELARETLGNRQETESKSKSKAKQNSKSDDNSDPNLTLVLNSNRGVFDLSQSDQECENSKIPVQTWNYVRSERVESNNVVYATDNDNDNDNLIKESRGKIALEDCNSSPLMQSGSASPKSMSGESAKFCLTPRNSIPLSVPLRPGDSPILSFKTNNPQTKCSDLELVNTDARKNKLSCSVSVDNVLPNSQMPLNRVPLSQSSEEKLSPDKLVKAKKRSKFPVKDKNKETDSTLPMKFPPAIISQIDSPHAKNENVHYLTSLDSVGGATDAEFF